MNNRKQKNYWMFLMYAHEQLEDCDKKHININVYDTFK